MTATKLLVSSITIKPDAPPDPPEDGSGARDPGDCAVPPPAVSPGTPLMLITTPEVGAGRAVWFNATWAACTWACAEATCASPDASELGLTWVCTAKLSREDVTCWEAEVIRVCPLTASMFCLVLSLASWACSWLHCAPFGQSAFTLAWSLATVAASAWLVALTDATVSL